MAGNRAHALVVVINAATGGHCTGATTWGTALRWWFQLGCLHRAFNTLVARTHAFMHVRTHACTHAHLNACTHACTPFCCAAWYPCHRAAAAPSLMVPKHLPSGPRRLVSWSVAGWALTWFGLFYRRKDAVGRRVHLVPSRAVGVQLGV